MKQQDNAQVPNVGLDSGKANASAKNAIFHSDDGAVPKDWLSRIEQLLAAA
jgi:hypothetical protein